MTFVVNKSPLTDADLNNLASTFITESLAKKASLFRVNDNEGADLLGYEASHNQRFGGLAFPYYLPEATSPRLYQLRPDVTKEGRKYLLPKGSRNILYFPPDIERSDLEDITLPIIVTEGVKKVLALHRFSGIGTAKPRFLALGVIGVWNWKGKNSEGVSCVIPDFQLIEWNGRDVSILFDANVATNQSVYAARDRLAKMLVERGARVAFVDIPPSAGVNGIDDLLGKWQEKSNTHTAIQKGLDLLKSSYPFHVDQIKEVVLDGRLALEICPDVRKKCKVTARNQDGEAIEIHSFDVSDSEKRAKYVRKLDYTNQERIEISRALLRLAERSDTLDSTPSPNTATETVTSSFEKLSNGKLVEQIKPGFAFYDPETDSFEIVESVTDKDGTKYEPFIDELLQAEIGGIYLAGKLEEYGSDSELLAEISEYLSHFVDLKPLYLKLAALYIVFTYIADKVMELSYINATGDLGSGKTRFGLVICLAARRGLALVNPTAANMFRIVDRFSPTLFLDEFNSKVNSDDTAAVIQILNAGFQQTAQIARQVRTADGNFKTELFNPYCPKIISSYKAIDSDAFRSRTIEIQMERTRRNDIPIRMTHKLLKESQKLRNKLTLWRLRNYSIDFESKLDNAETELRASGLSPRSIQINIPVYALMEDEELKGEFIRLLQKRDRNLDESKRNTFDGELVEAIQSILFEISEDPVGSERAQWRPRFSDRAPLKGKICEELRIERITASLNKERDREVNSIYVGKQVNKLGLRTRKIRKRKSEYRDKKAVEFDGDRLKVLFDNFGLAYPSDLTAPSQPASVKPMPCSTLPVGTSTSPNEDRKAHLSPVKPNNFNNCSDGANGDIKKLETLDSGSD
ncbi:MAG: DUF3854 domain-containing protein [Pyrinomonadaceae bacterium]|nr:DUF3854 domain-containing protein [Pyrinomonadaceae bacterium]